MNKVKQSFTLVEILVVIVIIGILSSFIFFTINDSVEKASIAKSKMFSESIRNNLLLNLVSEWKLDNGSGTVTSGAVIDAWGNNNAEAIEGSPQFKTETECVSGTCIEFDGDDAIGLGKNSSLDFGLGNFTVTGWFKSDPLIDYGAIIAKDMDNVIWWSVQLDSTKLTFQFDDNHTKFVHHTENEYDDGKWHNFVITRGSVYRIYVDSIEQEIEEDAANEYTLTNLANLQLGKRNLEAGYYIGLIDEIQIYNAVISEAQIKQNYLSGLNNLYANKD
jgi:prepilin-type N-terminal cleavage/methylation domain-containing protein